MAGQVVDESDDSDSDSDSSLSDADFEDVPLAKKQKTTGARGGEGESEDDGAEDDDEGIEFEDVQNMHSDGPLPSGDLELTLTRDTRIPLTNTFDKKGPSKLERKARIATHCAHVQYLMWHNAIRNAWLCDPEVQGLLISHLPSRLWDEVDRWRRNSGLEAPADPLPKKPSTSRSSTRKGKGKETSRAASREWDGAAQRLEKGVVDMSHGDPLIRLMMSLSSWWRQRFRITAPGLRKRGYMSLDRLDRLTKAYGSGDYDPSHFGERIRTLDEFRRCAQDCMGSRDVGSQLFTALLRGLGLEARMAANLQPMGFGWNKLEEADPETEREEGTSLPTPTKQKKRSQASPQVGPGGKKSKKADGPSAKPRQTRQTRQAKPSRRTSNSDDGTESFELAADDSDDEVVEIPTKAPKKTATYDKDLEFPHYWTEVLSPVTNKYMPVDPVVKYLTGTNRDKIESLEPRGGKADKAKQVIAYVVGFSQDGTAKDVTVRYLKRQIMPGRTKGVRMPVEKIPIHNRYGKVKRYSYFDWFKAVMRGYERGDRKHPITETDELENSTDLKPATPDKKEVKEGEETLQYYKQSSEFVLERHLKREEALLPTAAPVKTFKNKGKGSAAKAEPVYLRRDVVQVKSAETWHKQGREPHPGAEALKMVPYRAATTNRRREIAEAEAATGEKVLQALYSFEQTDWIIPPPIRDGIIPKNEYGNIDLFAEHMCPRGAVHVPYRGAMRVCKRLRVDFAEAVIDFEFGSRMAVPVIQGVVVAEEYYDQVMEELAKDEAEKARKEDEKRKSAALAMWRKFLMGMRIMEKLRQEYGEIKEGVAVFGHDSGPEAAGDVDGDGDEDMAGGFLPEGFEPDVEKEAHQVSGFFPVADDRNEGEDEDTLQMEHDEPSPGMRASPPPPYPTPQSAMSTTPKRGQTAANKVASSRRRRRRVQSSSPSDKDDDYEGEEEEQESD